MCLVIALPINSLFEQQNELVASARASLHVASDNGSRERAVQPVLVVFVPTALLVLEGPLREGVVSETSNVLL